MLMLSGDFLFVGSLGRPDLLGDAETEDLSRKLYRSSRAKIRDLPDGLEIHPAHGAGSMCGAGMSGRPQSTLGFERMANPYLDPSLSEEDFVQKIIAASPPFPAYYRRMKRVNSEGPTILNGLPGLEMIEVQRFEELMDNGALVIDIRGQKAFGASHIPGSFGIGAGTSLATWASWVVPYDTPLLLVADGDGPNEDAVRSLVRVGLDGAVGFLAGGMTAWRAEGNDESVLAQATPAELYGLLRSGNPPCIVDVRNDQEWLSGHLGTATHIMAGYLPDRLEEVPTDRRIALICQTGYRSTLAGSVLERSGVKDVLNLEGGMNAWNRAGLPLEAATPEAVET